MEMKTNTTCSENNNLIRGKEDHYVEEIYHK